MIIVMMIKMIIIPPSLILLSIDGAGLKGELLCGTASALIKIIIVKIGIIIVMIIFKISIAIISIVMIIVIDMIIV